MMVTSSTAGLLQISASAMQAHQTRLEAAAHNVANAGTAGFKRAKVFANDLEYLTLTPAVGGAIVADDLLQGSGTVSLAVGRDYSQGALETTCRSLDVAIEGEGFFVVRTADGGAAYTRDGSFGVDASGNLCTAGGLRLSPGVVVPDGGRIVGIDETGGITAAVNGGEPQVVGRLQLARFSNPAGLQPAGDNLFLATSQAGEAVTGEPGADGLGLLVPGTLERANTDLAGEMVSVLVAQRAYQLSARALQTTDEMLSLADDIFS